PRRGDARRDGRPPGVPAARPRDHRVRRVRRGGDRAGGGPQRAAALHGRDRPAGRVASGPVGRGSRRAAGSRGPLHLRDRLRSPVRQARRRGPRLRRGPNPTEPYWVMAGERVLSDNMTSTESATGSDSLGRSRMSRAEALARRLETEITTRALPAGERLGTKG